MKKLIIITLFLTGLAASAQMQCVDNIKEAKTAAAKSNKNIMIVFSGSDWCVPCMRLEKEILSQPGFEDAELNKLVLIKADFPTRSKNKKLISKTQQAYNANLFEKYNPKGIFPLVVLLNKNGKQIAVTGYKDLSPRAYAVHIDKLIGGE